MVIQFAGQFQNLQLSYSDQQIFFRTLLVTFLFCLFTNLLSSRVRFERSDIESPFSEKKPLNSIMGV